MKEQQFLNLLALLTFLFKLDIIKFPLKYLLIFFLLHFISKAQVNLVLNPSFEDTIACPLGPGEIYNSNGWSSFNGSPDYMNICNKFSMGVPVNWGGFQQPASGNAYAALLTYLSSSPNSREHISNKLSVPLVIGIKYYVSFQTCLSLGFSADGNCASNKLGANFLVGPYSGSSLINNNPKVYKNTIITDSLNWTRIFGSFVADSAYNYIVIGNFFDDLNTSKTKFYNTFSDAAYYYIDDVCLSTDAQFASNYNYTGVSKYSINQVFSIFPNPATDFVNIKSCNQSYSLRIYNILGQEIYTKEKTNGNLTLDLRSYNASMLIINLVSDKFNFNYKLLKQ